MIRKVAEFLCLCALAGAGFRLPAQTVQAGGDEVQIEKVEILGASADRIRFGVWPSVMSREKVQIRQIAFSALRLNGLPVFVPPVTEPLTLFPGERVRLRRALEAAVYYRDLESLEPLEAILRAGHLHVEGAAVLEARLSLIPSILLMSRTARAPLRFAVDLPLSIPGGSFTTGAALKVLALAEPGSRVLRRGVLSLLGTAAARARLVDRHGAAVMLALARYELQDRGGNRYPVETSGVAVRVAAARYVLPREFAEPWRFDPAIVAQLKRKEIAVAQDSCDLLLWPLHARVSDGAGHLDTSGALSYRKGHFRIRVAGAVPGSRMIVTRNGGDATLVQVAQRASAANLALLDFASPPAPGSGIEVDKDPNPAGFSRLAAFRFGPPRWTERAEPEVIALSGRIEKGRVVLDDPVDGSASGSPLILLATAGNALGIWTDKH